MVPAGGVRGIGSRAVVSGKRASGIFPGSRSGACPGYRDNHQYQHTGTAGRSDDQALWVGRTGSGHRDWMGVVGYQCWNRAKLKREGRRVFKDNGRWR